MMASKNGDHSNSSGGISSPEESMQASQIKRTFEFGTSIDFGSSPPEVIPEIGRNQTSSPTADDVMKLREDIRQLRAHNRELQAEITEDEELSSKLRQKVNQLEEKNLELTSNFNNENSKLQSELARLRSEVEQGEAARQVVEYELTMARNAGNLQKRLNQEKQQELNSVIENSAEKIHDLQTHIQDVENEFKKMKTTYEAAEDRYNSIITEKEQLIATITTQLEVMRTEKEQLDQVFQEQEGIYEEAQEKIEQLEIERNTQTDTVRRQVKDIEYGTEREQRLKEQLQEVLSKVKMLEENIETERAAHLESKFNSEIVQLRVRDLEGAFDVEKSAHSEASRKMEILSKQLIEIQHLYDTEQEKGKETKNILNRLNQEHKNVKKQLSSDLEEKNIVIGELSHQLDLHQKNFDGLKEELKKAKKRQIFLEETYGGCMRELDLLLNNYQIGKKETGKTKNRQKTSKDDRPITPSTVVVTLKSTLANYQDQLDGATSELSKLKSLYEKVAKECQQYKEVTWSRSATVQDLQEKLVKTTKGTEQLRTKCQQSDIKLGSLKAELKKAAKMCQEERNQFTVLAEELHQRSKESIKSEENKRLYLHSLYQRILAGRIVMEPSEPTLTSFSWNDLSVAVHDQVVSLMNLLKTEKDQINDLETALRQKDLKIQTLQQQHEQRLEHATMSGEERTKRLMEEKDEVEERYTKMFEELQSKSRKTQGLADQAWEKVRLMSTVKEGLESECKQLRVAVEKSKIIQASLLAACCLLTGAYMPLCRRAKQLANQRDILEQQLAERHVMKEKVLELVCTLALKEDNKEMGKSEGDMSMLMKFRASVIAVIAANRLRRLLKQSQCLFMSTDIPAGITSTIVCLPQMKQVQGSMEISDKSSHSDDLGSSTAATAISWLTSQQTLTSILQATSDLSELLMLTPEQMLSLHSKKATQLIEVAFQRLVNCLGPAYETPESSKGRFPRDRSSLVFLLGLGLKRALGMASYFKKGCPSTARAITSTLQKHVLEFTQRLHAAEVERRSLRIEVSKLRKDSEDLKESEEKNNVLSQQLDDLQRQRKHLIEKEKFESVCRELSSALQREHKAQEILNEQSNQLEEMSMRLNVQTTEELERNTTISEAVKGLSEAKMELRRRDQSMRQINRQLSQLETEKKELQERLTSTENVLLMSTKEKEAVTSYLKSIEMAVEDIKRHIISRTDLKQVDTILNQMLSHKQRHILEVAQPSPDAKTLQNVIETFVEAQKTTLSRMAALESEIDSNKQHIATLKNELNAVCKREYDDEEVMLSEESFHDIKRNHPERSFGRLRPLFEPEKSSLEAFVPLTEEPDYSLKFTTTSPSKSFLMHPDNVRMSSSPRRSERKVGQHNVRHRDEY
ncbi:coiled-coil domain-containing protein 171-like [Anneissia japonica]|uniref:coiled-coil domain-containing protein 171-like n=1 Tax=Anneissia japonica TaxID=1529436 RepID=UPI00142580EB|nr:coiled-coil domain-containing protein 171-like [Anneissia japonica]